MPAVVDRPVDPHVGVNLWRVIRSEWIKLWSVRSTVIGFCFAVVMAVGFGMLFSAFAGNDSGQAGEGPGEGLFGPLAISQVRLRVRGP